MDDLLTGFVWAIVSALVIIRIFNGSFGKNRELNHVMGDLNRLMPKGPGRMLLILSSCFCLDKPQHMAQHNSYVYYCALLAFPLING